VDARVWHKVGLELSKIDVEGTIEPKRGGDRGHDLGDETVEVGVGWALNVEIAAADIVERLVVEHDGHISVLKKRVDTEHSVVRLHHCCGHLRA
jgi:hypothetical protein